MARAAWGLAAVAAVVAAVAMTSNSRLRADNAELELKLVQATAARPSGKPVRSNRPGPRPPQPGLAPVIPPSGVLPEMAPEQLLAEIPEEALLNTPGVEHQLQAEVSRRVQEEIGTRREEWKDRRRAHIARNVSEFAEEANLNEDTREELQALMEDAMDDSEGIQKSQRAHGMSIDEGYEKTDALQLELESDLIDLLGEDDADAFLETVRGPLK